MTVSVPVIHPRAGVTVRIDAETHRLWTEAGLPMTWTWTASGPTVLHDGRETAVADLILGRPGRLASGGPFDLTMSNLEPLDGTPADTSGLDVETTPETTELPTATLSLSDACFEDPEDHLWPPPAATTFTSQTLSCGTVVQDFTQEPPAHAHHQLQGQRLHSRLQNTRRGVRIDQHHRGHR